MRYLLDAGVSKVEIEGIGHYEIVWFMIMTDGNDVRSWLL